MRARPESSPTATSARRPSETAPGRPSSAPLGEVFRSWLPLATSWLVMGLELPIVSAVMARLADPEINLAAYGGVTMPIALLIEAPIMMLLSASTALGRDLASRSEEHTSELQS